MYMIKVCAIIKGSGDIVAMKISGSHDIKQVE
jgi:hypothetical protein